MLLDEAEGTVVVRVGGVTITIVTSSDSAVDEISEEILAERALLHKVRFIEGV